MYLMQRSILAPKNTDVDEVNNGILESLSKESHTYLSANSLTPTKEGASVAAGVSMDSLYPVEFLDTLRFSGIANHELELKVGVPILLLRNLNQSIGLCNGTRLIVKRLGQRVIVQMKPPLKPRVPSSVPPSLLYPSMCVDRCVIFPIFFKNTSDTAQQVSGHQEWEGNKPGTMKPPLTPRDEAAPEAAHSGPL